MPYKKRHHRKNHIDDWLMTYADMITLLLCFFAILLAMSVPKQEKFDQAKKKVAEKFASKSFLAKMSTEVAPEELPATKGLLAGLETTVDLAGIKHNVVITEKDDFITISLVSDPFFDAGSATLTKEGNWLLAEIVKDLNKRQLRHYSITIEGHTDDTAFSSPAFASNWELSTARAITALRFFMAQGVPVNKLSASGYADAHPALPNRDSDGQPLPENQAKNRRLMIILKKVGKDYSS